MSLTESLEELVMLWVVQRPQGIIFNADFENLGSTEIPSPLISTVTSKEPYLSQVLADAKIYLRCPALFGLGRNIELKEPLEVVPFHGWGRTISPLKFRVRWSATMGGDNSEYVDDEINRVAFEGDRWKIVSMWDERTREDTLKFIEWLRKRKPAE